MLEGGAGFNSEYVRHRPHTAFEPPRKSPSQAGERLREFRESNLESLKFHLFSEAPIYKDSRTSTSPTV